MARRRTRSASASQRTPTRSSTSSRQLGSRPQAAPDVTRSAALPTGQTNRQAGSRRHSHQRRDHRNESPQGRACAPLKLSANRGAPERAGATGRSNQQPQEGCRASAGCGLDLPSAPCVAPGTREVSAARTAPAPSLSHFRVYGPARGRTLRPRPSPRRGLLQPRSRGQRWSATVVSCSGLGEGDNRSGRTYPLPRRFGCGDPAPVPFSRSPSTFKRAATPTTPETTASAHHSAPVAPSCPWATRLAPYIQSRIVSALISPRAVA